MKYCVVFRVGMPEFFTGTLIKKKVDWYEGYIYYYVTDSEQEVYLGVDNTIEYIIEDSSEENILRCYKPA